jgi:hypothetical protein
VSQAGAVTTVAGNGTTTDAANGAPAVDSGLNGPVAVAPLSGGGFLVTEYNGSVVRMVSAQGTITTIAGTGTPGTNGGNNTTSGPATSIQLNYPTDAQPLPDGSVLIADTYNDVIRDVSPSGTMSTIAGGGSCNDTGASSCDGMPAGGVALDLPDSISPIQGGSGGYLMAEYGADAVRKVSQVSTFGTFTTVAGTPVAAGYGGDGGPATAAHLSAPEQVASTADGGYMIADTNNEVIRDVSPAGTITTVAGTPGVASYAGDGGDATAADLDSPSGVSPLPGGGFLIADADNGAIREVTIPPTTTITLNPRAPNGNNGWYVSPVAATVTTTEGAQISCELDPPSAPPAFGAIPSGCPFTGAGGQVTGDGAHTLYAASVNSFGDQEVPVSLTLNIDATPPTVTCNAAPSFLAGTPNALVTGTVADQTSGPAAAQISAAAPTSALGIRATTLSGVDRAGNVTSVSCPYTVLPLTLKPRPILNWAFNTKVRRTRVDRLLLSHVPAHAAVNLTCGGRGCPFTAATNVSGKRCHGKPCKSNPSSREPARSAVNLALLFAGARLATGATLTVSVTETNTIGRVWVFTFRTLRRPTAHAACLMPGSSKPGVGCS